MVQSKTLADQIYQQLETGADFATLSRIYDPISGGELGWFPKNTLVLPDIEEAVFILEPGEYTPVLNTAYGYQIIQVMERGVRSLTQSALLTLQKQALTNWITENKNQSEIKVLD
jgi:parvulin-like peptidyl-prolyl isomerase